MTQRRTCLGWLRMYGVGVASLLLLAAISVSAQISTGTILGVVKDTTGGTIAGAAVTVINTDTALTRTGSTEEDGSYRFPALPVGNYEVKVMKDGFQTADRKGITLEVTQEAAIDVTLQVGTTGQTVTVTEEAPQVDTTNAAIGAIVAEQQVADLPLNGRNFVDLSLMQAGITQTTNAGIGSNLQNGTEYSSNGAPARSNSVRLDGAIMVNMNGTSSSSVIGTTFGVDGIKEYRVATNQFSAEYGLTMGSQTVIVSKGGTNEWHGDVFEYLRNSSMDAGNYFDTLDSTNHNGFGTDKSLPFPGKRIPPFQRNNFGASGGGPLRKNKTFFYLVYEGLRSNTGLPIATLTFPLACFRDANNVLQPVIPAIINNATTGANANPNGACITGAGAPTGTFPVTQGANGVLGLADIFPQPNVTGLSYNYTFPDTQHAGENYGQARLDETFSAADNGFFRYTHDTSTLTGLGAYPQTVNVAGSASQFATLGEDHVFSPTILNSFRASWSRTVYGSGAYTSPHIGGPFVTLVDYPDTNPTHEMGGVSPGSGITGGPSGRIYGAETQDVVTWSDDVFWTKGKHALKFGTLVNYYLAMPDYHFTPTGSVSFSTLAAFFASPPDYSNLTQDLGVNNRSFRYDTFGYYAQDDFRASSRLTLNLGLRYEFETTPMEITGKAYSLRNAATDPAPTPGPIFQNPSLHAFSPRIGFAWDVFGNGKTAIRGGSGIYYDIGNFGTMFISNEIGTPPASNRYVFVNNAAVPSVPFSLPLPSVENQPNAPRGIEYYQKQPTLWQRSLTIDQQLPWDMALSVSYIGSRGWHIMQVSEGNLTIPVGTGANGLPIYCVANASGACPGAVQPPKENPAFSQDVFVQSNADSYYNSLQVTLQKRLTHGLQFQTAYTRGKTIDDGQGQFQTDPEATGTPGIPRLDRGPAVFDAANNLRINVLYHAPNIMADKRWAAPLHGWWFGSIMSFQSGYPFTPTLGADRTLQNNVTASDRPDLGPTFNAATAVTGNPKQWFNPTMFNLPVAGTYGNEARGELRGPTLKDVDLSVNKDTKARFLGEQGSVEFRAEIFNSMNHPNFGAPNATAWTSATPANSVAGPIGSAAIPAFGTAGAITTTSNQNRQIQLALKVIF